MSTLFVYLGVILLVTATTDVALSTCAGVGCCGQPISIIVWLNPTHLRALINKEANSASAADDITNLIICAIVSTAPLKVGIETFYERHT